MTETSGDQQSCCAREKYWSELSIEEKIERMRVIVNDQNEIIKRQMKRINKLESKFSTHFHTERGTIARDLGHDLPEPLWPMGETQKNEDINKVYF